MRVEVSEEEFRDLVHEYWMRLPPEDRVEAGARMTEAFRDFLIASVPPNLPELTRKQIFYQQMYGEPWPIDFQPADTGFGRSCPGT
jgi:hypothetical protein